MRSTPPRWRGKRSARKKKGRDGEWRKKSLCYPIYDCCFQIPIMPICSALQGLGCANRLVVGENSNNCLWVSTTTPLIYSLWHVSTQGHLYLHFPFIRPGTHPKEANVLISPKRVEAVFPPTDSAEVLVPRIITS